MTNATGRGGVSTGGAVLQDDRRLAVTNAVAGVVSTEGAALQGIEGAAPRGLGNTA